jgi:hypothetical protein
MLNLLANLFKIINSPSRVLLKLLDFIAPLVPDEYYLKTKYYLIIKKPLDLKNPKTFNEKIQWLKLNDKNPTYSSMADKYEVKSFVSDVIGQKYIIPTLGIYNKFSEIDFQNLPAQFVLKCTHDSGGIVICKNKADLNLVMTKNKLEKHLKKNPFLTCREWPYKNIKPRIIIEEYLNYDNSDLIDYKFLVFNGKVKGVFTCSERNSKSGLKVNFYDEYWNLLPFKRVYNNSINAISKPSLFNEMKELSEKLAGSIQSKFVRIDLYFNNNKIYFGEITFYPGGGWEEFSPEVWDIKLGSMINI